MLGTVLSAVAFTTINYKGETNAQNLENSYLDHNNKVFFKALSGYENKIDKSINDKISYPSFVTSVDRTLSKVLFGYKTEGANSYRIPGIMHDGSTIYANADKRIENIGDYNNTIDQVMKISHDDGKTWSNNMPVISVKISFTQKRFNNWWFVY